MAEQVNECEKRRDGAAGAGEAGAQCGRQRAVSTSADTRRAMYDAHAPRLYRLALRLTGNEADAADVVQETFVRAFERLETFGGRADVGTWLYRIATNESLQLLRRRRRQRVHLARWWSLRDRAAGGDGMGARLDVEAALQRLDGPSRAVLLLRYQEGLDYRQIAEVLGCRVGTVASRLNRARERLRALLGVDEAQEEEDQAGGHLT